MKLTYAVALLLSTATAAHTKGELGHTAPNPNGQPKEMLAQVSIATNAHLNALGAMKIETAVDSGKLACNKANCSDYRGKMNTTVSGKKCQAWTADTPHTTHDYKPTDKPGMGLEDGAYCRNPDNEEHVWCFTMDKSETWEICPDPLKVEVEEPEIVMPMPMPMPTGGIPCPIAKINMTKAQSYLKSTTTSFNSSEAHTQAAEAAFKAKMAMANGLYATRTGSAKAKFAAAQAAYATAQAAAQAVYDASQKASKGFEITFNTVNTEYESASMHMDEMSMKLQMGEASVMTCIPMHPPVDRRACMQAGRELEAITVKNEYEQTEVKYRIETRDYYLRGYQAYRAKGWQGMAGQFYNNYAKWARNANEQIEVLQKSEIAMEEATLKKEKVCDEGTTGAPPPTADMFGPFGPPPRRG